ncbi:SGNH/GDSL hydrolase family protein [Mediterraneibacter glycyrrhizinilyticus]|nr:SGNH/GDSL hydrolase family protein [Mediterraneibacter glycyrrhizinilyticus]
MNEVGQMKKRTKVILIILAAVVVLQAAWIAFCGWKWGWGPFHKLSEYRYRSMPGNADRYAVSQVKPSGDETLKGKTVIFLGSSVTYGAASLGESFADDLSARLQCNVVKEAVSGTTLSTTSPNSYVTRLDNIKTRQADLFICQLSTNDASQKKPLGEVTDSERMEDFDTDTVAGAMEYIIAYAKDKWDCPVVFYTNPKYDSDEYAAMVELLYEIRDKWGIGVIDLWTELPEITEEERALYMADAIHPTRAGYLEWWTPVMEKDIIEMMELTPESSEK